MKPGTRNNLMLWSGIAGAVAALVVMGATLGWGRYLPATRGRLNEERIERLMADSTEAVKRGLADDSSRVDRRRMFRFLELQSVIQTEPKSSQEYQQAAQRLRRMRTIDLSREDH